jgi:hypothetical protein
VHRVTLIEDDRVRRLLGDSTIVVGDWDSSAASLEAVLREIQSPPAEVLAVSLNPWGNGPFIAVCRRGVAIVRSKGIFKPRFEVQFVEFGEITTLAQDEAGYSKAPESVIEALGDNSVLFRLKWVESPDDEGEATRERDRVFDIMLAAWRAVG